MQNFSTTRRNVLLGGMLASVEVFHGKTGWADDTARDGVANDSVTDHVSSDGAAHDGEIPVAARDWLVNAQNCVARVDWDAERHYLVLDNGLARRVLALMPCAEETAVATMSLKNLTSGEEYIRAVGPEATITLDGVEYPIGGLTGQKINNYLKPEWLTEMKPLERAYRYHDHRVSEIEERFAWQKRPEWMPRDVAWPPRGKHLVMSYVPPETASTADSLATSSDKSQTVTSTADSVATSSDKSQTVTSTADSVASTGSILPNVEVHYEIYDGIPLIAKWIEVVLPSEASQAVRLNQFVSENLRLVEPESNVDGAALTEQYRLHVECDYTFGGMYSTLLGTGVAVRLEKDSDYPTQVNYLCETKCLLRCTPPLGPDQILKPGERFESFRVYELLHDSTDRERRGLGVRRMYRTIAPWTTENPLMFHKVQSDPNAIREAVAQCRETGFELVIMSFGSGFNLESRDPEYRKLYRELTDEAKQSGVALGGYSLTSSRGAATAADNVQTAEPRFGVGPCLGSQWGVEYFATLRSFMEEAGFGVFENDGPYPGDCCEATTHPGHRGVDDSQWVQWRAQSELYRWCRARGIYVNQPDGYFLNGGSKTGMGYRETNWSLPRAEQVIIERQNIYDGTWTKLNSMGWMFVPLSQYHGGGAAATIEPLCEHLEHYDARFANLIGAGVQACYRGPRLFDTPETKAIVCKWVNFYKTHREVLDGELIHLRRATGRDWDGWLHVNPRSTTGGQGLAFLYNPLTEDLELELTIPLYYTGLTGLAVVRGGDSRAWRSDMQPSEAETVVLDEGQNAVVRVTIPAEGYAWRIFERT